jgi:hypothetical protein
MRAKATTTTLHCASLMCIAGAAQYQMKQQKISMILSRGISLPVRARRVSSA